MTSNLQLSMQRYLRWAVAGVLLFAMLQMLGLVVSFYSLGERLRQNHELNAAGGQRMLSQQMARLVYEMDQDFDDAAHHEASLQANSQALDRSMHTFAANLDAFISGGELTDPDGDRLLVPGTAQPGLAVTARERWQLWSRSLEPLTRPGFTRAQLRAAVAGSREHSAQVLNLMVQLTHSVEEEQAQALRGLRNVLVTGLAAAALVFALMIAFVLNLLRRAQAAQAHALELASRSADENTLLRRVAERTTNLVVVTDAGGRIEWVNASFERITGHTLTEARGRQPGALLQGKDTDAAAVQRLRGAIAEGHAVSGVEILNYTKAGVPYWVEMEVQPLQSPDGRIDRYMAIETVVTERHAVRVKLEAALAEADRSNAAKNLFLARISHELRTPLNAMFGFAEMLWREAEQLNPKQREFVKHIVSAGRHVLELIGDIHDLALIEADQLRLHQGPVDLATLADEVAQELRPLAGEHQVTLEAAAPPAEPMHVRADRMRLKEVLINLVSNAVKYNHAGGRVRLAVAGNDAYASVRVADTGGGMSAQQREALFQPFNRLGAERSDVRGTGIGLAISHRLVLAMSGRIDVQSELGIGTTMTVSLPRLLGVALAEPAAPVDVQEAPVEGLVLYVEDNAVNMEIFAAVVDTLPGVQLLRAVDGNAGLQMVHNELPDVIVIDKNLPDMDGAEVLAQLRSQPRLSAARIVMYSADATQTSIDLALGTGFDDYWIKPMPVDALRAGLRTMLARAVARRKRRISSRQR